MLPSTIQIRGNRNLIVAAAPPPTAQPTEPVQPPPAAATATTATTEAPAAAPRPPAAQPTGPRATLEEILRQADPRRRLQVQAPDRLRIGQDRLHFTLTSASDGYLYVVLLGSDERSFYLLFPNRLDADNRVRAGRSLRLPRATGEVTAGGPPGTNRMLVVVTQSPLDAKVFGSPDAGGGPFAWSVADAGSGGRLVDLFVGRGPQGRGRGLGAVLLDIREEP
jgi:hypothetical protein